MCVCVCVHARALTCVLRLFDNFIHIEALQIYFSVTPILYRQTPMSRLRQDKLDANAHSATEDSHNENCNTEERRHRHVTNIQPGAIYLLWCVAENGVVTPRLPVFQKKQQRSLKYPSDDSYLNAMSPHPRFFTNICNLCKFRAKNLLFAQRKDDAENKL